MLSFLEIAARILDNMKNPLYVLNLEDDPTDHLILKQTLKQAGITSRAHRVDNLNQLQKALDNQVWDCIISDNSIPGLDAFKALSVCSNAQPATPFIILSNSLDPQVALRALNKGACDFISKAQWHRLVPSIRKNLDIAIEEPVLSNSEKAELFDKIVTSIDQALVVLDTKCEIRLWNESFLNLSTQPFSVGMDFFALYPLLKNAHFHTCIKQTLENGVTNLCTVDLKVTGVERRFNCIIDKCSMGILLRFKPNGIKPLANQELGGFLNHITQKIKSPTATFQGILNLADLEVEDPRARELFQQFATTTNDLEYSIQKVHTLNRVKTGFLHIRKIDFTKLFYEVKKELKLPPSNKAALQINTPAYTEIYTDPYLLKCILINVIENGIKFNDPQNARVVVDIQMDAQSDSNDQVYLKIQDNGIGIPMEAQNRIFDGHYRNESGRKGLGMYIVKTAIEKLSGELQIKSAPQRGTLLEFRIPNLTVFKK